MDIKKALSIIGRYTPCGHHNIDTDLGTGDVWAKCEDCGQTFEQELLDLYRTSESVFDDAVDTIRAALEDREAQTAKKTQRGKMLKTTADNIENARREFVEKIVRMLPENYNRRELLVEVSLHDTENNQPAIPEDFERDIKWECFDPEGQLPNWQSWGFFGSTTLYLGD